MSEASFRERLLGHMREHPALYATVRRCYRTMLDSPREILRVVAPRGSRFGPPKGQFSALALLQAGQVEGRVGWSGQEIAPAGPDSMIARCGYRQDAFQPWPAFWTRHHEMRLVGWTRRPLDDAKRICAESIYGLPDSDPREHYLVLPRPTRLEGPWISLIPGNFFHWMHEELPRLWALPELPPEVGVMIGEKPAPFVWDTLRWLGLEKRVRLTPERHLVIEDYYFLAPTAMQGAQNPIAVQFLRKHFLERADRDYAVPARRIYLKRTNKTRGMVNDAEVEAFFRGRGWAVVDPEQLSLAQQIAVFAQAEGVCGLHGAGFSNLAWCQPACRVLELFAEGSLNGCYEGVARCLGLPYRWLLFPADGEFRAEVNTEQIAAILDEWSL